MGHKRRSNPGTRTGIVIAVIILISLISAFRYEIINRAAGNDPGTLLVLPGVNHVNGLKVIYSDSEKPAIEEGKYFFYDQLSVKDKKAYELFLDLASHREDKRYKSELIVPGKHTDTLSEHLFCVYLAMYYDHPEFFWLENKTGENRITSEYRQSGGTTYMEYSLKEPEDGENQEITRFSEAADAFMANIDMSQSDDKITMQIHDELIKLVSYDDALLQKSKQEPLIRDLGQTAYGGLVADSNGTPNTVTCIGYAMTYEYLLHRAGIYATVVNGSATSCVSEFPESGGHAWNLVKIGNEWYETDACWDDLELSTFQFEPNFVSAVMADTLKYNNSRHWFYNRTTAQMADLKACEETAFYVEGYEAWNSESSSIHSREQEKNGDPETNEVYEYLETLQPDAEGTEYAYEYK